MRKVLFVITLVFAIVVTCSLPFLTNASVNRAVVSKPSTEILTSRVESQTSSYLKLENDSLKFGYEDGQCGAAAERLNQSEPVRYLEPSRDGLDSGVPLTPAPGNASKRGLPAVKSELATGSILQVPFAPSSEPAAMLFFGLGLIAIGSMLHRFAKVQDAVPNHKYRGFPSIQSHVHR